MFGALALPVVERRRTDVVLARDFLWPGVRLAHHRIEQFASRSGVCLTGRPIVASIDARGGLLSGQRGTVSAAVQAAEQPMIEYSEARRGTTEAISRGIVIA